VVSSLFPLRKPRVWPALEDSSQLLDGVQAALQGGGGAVVMEAHGDAELGGLTKTPTEPLSGPREAGQPAFLLPGAVAASPLGLFLHSLGLVPQGWKDLASSL
jgi:hypothetical protein